MLSEPFNVLRSVYASAEIAGCCRCQTACSERATFLKRTVSNAPVKSDYSSSVSWLQPCLHFLPTSRRCMCLQSPAAVGATVTFRRKPRRGNGRFCLCQTACMVRKRPRPKQEGPVPLQRSEVLVVHTAACSTASRTASSLTIPPHFEVIALCYSPQHIDKQALSTKITPRTAEQEPWGASDNLTWLHKPQWG